MLDFVQFGEAFDLYAKMPQAGLGGAGRDCKVDSWIFKHPLGVVVLEDGGLGGEETAIKANAFAQIVDGDMHVETFHDDSFLNQAQLGAHAVVVTSQADPAQQFSVRKASRLFIAA